MAGHVLAQEVVTVGILHSLTGDMALSETSVVDAEKMAIDEINASGGVLGRQIDRLPAVFGPVDTQWPVHGQRGDCADAVRILRT